MGKTNYSDTAGSVVSLFHQHAFHFALYWIVGVALVALLVATIARWIPRFNVSAQGLNEPRARTYLRIAFGVIWLIDGVLQFQPGMPLGLANDVVQPAVSGAPSWFHGIMHDAIHLWNIHPIAMATGSAWVEIGLGIGLLVSNAAVGRFVAAASVVWGLLIWVVANGLGGAFASGASLLFGWPGATLVYCYAGVWLALNPETFRRHFSRVTLWALGGLVAVAAILQCLPAAGFWKGGNANALTAMAKGMTATAQPHPLAWTVRRIGSLAGTLGGGFNVIVLLWMVACVIGLVRATRRDSRWGVVTFAVGCVVWWVVAQDLSIWGGVATDVNSMIPLAAVALVASPRFRDAPPLRRRLPEEIRSASGAALAALALSMVAFSAISMGVASVSAAETTLYNVQNGGAISVSLPAQTFTLTDQHGQPYTLDGTKGRFTILTFLDPVCWTDCPLIAAQVKTVLADLPANAPIDAVAVAANPDHQSLTDVRHFIALHDLGSVKNFYYVTGPVAKTRKVWNSYGITVYNTPTSVMSIHSDFIFIIGPTGRLEWEIPDDPVNSSANQESTVTEVLNLLHQSGLS